MELWERAAALEQLEDVLRASSAGGRVVLVAGEAGIGKSSLVTEFARRVEDRARVLWGGCDRLVTPRALGPLHDVGRQTGGALAERLTAGATQEELFAAFLDELAPDPARLQVVVVEDAHWADEATLDWLVFLARRMERLPALLVVTYRDDEVGADHPLRSVLGAMPAAVSTRVVVPALSRECVLDQAHRAGRDAESVYRLAGGNALLVTEVLKSDPDAVPGAVQDLILERIRALPHGARDVAHLVAVVPTRAGAAVTGTSEAVDRCIGAGVLVPAGDGVAYRHELLRSAVEDSLSPARRAELHALVLRTLAEDPGSDPGLLVHHARLAGDPDSVLRYGQVAGASAVRQGAYREAVAHYGAAAAYADRLDEPERAHLYEQHGLAAYLAGRYEDALAARKAALAVREGLGQPSWSVRTCAGSRGSPGGRASAARRGPRLRARSRSSRPHRPGRRWRWPTATRPSSRSPPTSSTRRPRGPPAPVSSPSASATPRPACTRGCPRGSPPSTRNRTPRSASWSGCTSRRQRTATSSTPAGRSQTWPW
jgi:hypothetical protein